MGNTSPPKSRDDFQVAIICALTLEADAVEACFDRFWDEDGDQYGKAPGDQNAYRTGTIGSHNVVLAYMPDIGKGRAASVAANLRSSFQSIRVAAIVGVCGGVPYGVEKGIFLGDVIISDGIVLYDFGRKLPHGFYPKENAPSSGAAVSSEIRAFLHKLRSQKGRESLLEKKTHHLAILQNRTNDYQRPVQKTDRLFQSAYTHKHQEKSNCKRCKVGRLCKKASEGTCETVGCNLDRLFIRTRSTHSGHDIHFGRIASGDTVMKCGKDRDRIATRDNIIAFEMEGAGVSGNLPCIVIKGVCDYADSHKNKQWQKYAAGAAAACMRSMLEQWSTTDQYQTPRGDLSSNEFDFIQPESCRADVLSKSAQMIPLTTDGHHDKPYKSCEEEKGGLDGDKDSDLMEALSEIKSSFKTVMSCFKRHYKKLPRSSELKITLKAQRAKFLSSMEICQSHGTHSSGKSNGTSSSSAGSFKIVQAIQVKLQEILDITTRLSVSINSIINSPPQGVSLQSGNARHGLEYAIEDLRSLMEVFTDLTSKKIMQVTREPEQSRWSTRVPGFQNFRIVQEAANSLYNAFKTVCREHTVHNVYLSLEPDCDLGRVKRRVKFNIALIPDAMKEKSVWINVESTVKSSGSCATPGYYSPVLPDARRKRSRVEGGYREDLECSENIQLQVSVESDHSISYFPTQSTSIPNLSLQQNFCAIVERSLNRPTDRDSDGTCIGILGDSDIYTHLAYMDSQVKKVAALTSLSQLISSSRGDPTGTTSMGLYERIRLGRYLAMAFLYYHVTPWLNESWSSDDVQVFLTWQHPFITTSIQGSSSGKSPDTNPSSSDHSHFIRNPVLFRLGVMLLELAYQAPLERLRQPEDQQKGEKYGVTDYFTACRLAEKSNSVTGSQNFKRIVKKCLHCDFGHDSDFKNTALQEAFYHDVITGPAGLERLEGIFQEMQLDG